MTAYDLIDSIFARVDRRTLGDMRIITRRQLDTLHALIREDPERDKVRPGSPGSLIWSPAGRTKYVITEDPTGGEKHTLVKLMNLRLSGEGRLFG